MNMKEARKVRIKASLIADKKLKQFLLFGYVAIFIVSCIYILCFSKINLPSVALIFIFIGLFLVLYIIYYFAIVRPLEKLAFENREEQKKQLQAQIAKEQAENNMVQDLNNNTKTPIQKKKKSKHKKKKRK